MLHEWMSRPHWVEWWGEPDPWEAFEADYGASVDDPSPLQRYIVSLDGRAFGFIQSYIAKDCGGGWWEDVTDPGVRGIDQSIASADDLGRGLGTAMVRAFVARLFTDPAVTLVQTDPHPRNARAIRCYQKAGFRPVKEIVTPDGPALLMVCARLDAGPGPA
jgi:RimJ/RimL family protein N-acetyltransferase